MSNAGPPKGANSAAAPGSDEAPPEASAQQASARWQQRPPGSNWGEFGADDQRGRLNLLTAERRLRALEEVQTGEVFCLSLPLDRPGGNVLNPRPLAAGVPSRVKRGGEVYFNLAMQETDPRLHRRRLRRGDHALLAVLDALGRLRAQGHAVRCRWRRRCGESVLQRLSPRRRRAAKASTATSARSRCRSPKWPRPACRAAP